MDVIEELTDHRGLIDRVHVQRRIDDWRHRIASLYDTLERWFPSGWTVHRRGDVPMDEPLMRSVGASVERLPSLELLRGSLSVRVEPRGLWIMGANGRLDVVSPLTHAVIIDQADLYEAPRWTITPFHDQLNPRALTREAFVELLP